MGRRATNLPFVVILSDCFSLRKGAGTDDFNPIVWTSEYKYLSNLKERVIHAKRATIVENTDRNKSSN